ncbi:reverse transcriptase N-terminal domain-containing protein [Microseira wollei]|uniref:RNA-directed DNA polymerase (Reverse transcriptase) n=1 Tax=Microseira wollei NIES-4236 TaxID=2530354 RepID=A0AAV3XTV8_9CYAN|nr:reverse transcriptase N-terminal domain-containing protein [Microseira wollei]GET44497.1 RNA-directed DNA polymerase (Reverse transcriptase) [Microseira wollei NIES-4236]
MSELKVLVVMPKPKSDSPQNTQGWKRINWRQVEGYVFKLQKRIYAASRCGDVKRVRQLQKTLMKSWSNRVLAVRKVTQDHPGPKTAAVDGVR